MKVNDSAFSNYVQQNTDIASAQNLQTGKANEKQVQQDEIKLSKEGILLQDAEKAKESALINDRDHRVEKSEEALETNLEESTERIIASGREQSAISGDHI